MMTTETLKALLDEEITRAIDRIHASQVELERDISALREERDRRALERQRRRIDESDGDGFSDEEFDT
jgi:hypothetical protein